MSGDSLRTAGRRIVGSALLAAMGAMSAATSAAEQKLHLKLTFPTDFATFGLPYYVSKDTGWYAERGLEIQEVSVIGDANALRTVLAGDAHVTMVGLPVIIDALIAGAQIAAIGSWQPIVDYMIVGRKGAVEKLEDIPGKTLASAGPGGMTTEFPKMLLQKHGLDPGSVRFLQVGGHADRLRSVVVGTSQAAMVNIITATRGAQDGEVAIVRSLAEDFPNLGYVLAAVRKGDLQDPETRKALELFIEGSIHGARFVMDNPEQAADIFHARAPAMDRAFIAKVITQLNGLGVWGVNGGAEREVIDYTARVSYELGMTSRQVTADDVLDASLVEEILGRIGTR